MFYPLLECLSIKYNFFCFSQTQCSVIHSESTDHLPYSGQWAYCPMINFIANVRPFWPLPTFNSLSLSFLVCRVCVVRVCVGLSPHVYTDACVWHQCLPLSLSAFLLVLDSLLNLPVQLSWPANEFYGSSYLSTALELQACVARPSFLCEDWRIQAQVLTHV